MLKNRIDVITLGCSKNLVDSEKLMKLLEENGHTLRHNPDKVNGEIVVINTCGFIGDAKEESINMILEVCELKAKKKVRKVFVMGCLSERYMTELGDEIPQVDKYYGKFDWAQLVDDLAHSAKNDSGIAETSSSLREELGEVSFIDRVQTTPQHYAYVKISEGCDRTCAYCAIPIITGRHVSRPMEEIVDEVRLLVSRGVSEIQLIAQDLTYYGVDLYKKQCIAELVERIADVEGVKWVRLHYGYPTHFPMDLLRVMRERDNVCKYLDIALQHVSTNVLRNMRRNITKEETIELLQTIRREVPGIYLRTTLMVGFPGETEEEFEELVQFTKDMRFERMGAFAYSEEEGTYAAEHFEDNIDDDTKQARLSRLMRVQQRIAEEVSAASIGKTFQVVVDREEGEYFVGRTQYDSPEVDPEVLLLKTDNEVEIGHYYMVEITGADEFDLYGKVISNK
ncbi:MAG: 30S ribosomal protein S12 methylthiotransferase RimO [Bacteroidaceae bacterium]|nr:30S ribosomal protein S12 methylthiotransferase RimO [Bacteroidaceae bacterium]